MGSLIPASVWLAVPLVTVAACAGDALEPISGALEVTVTVGGPGSDLDGFLVVVDRSIQRPLGAGIPVVLASLRPGDHDVSLEGIGPSCSALSVVAQRVTVTAGDTARAAFEVACQAAAATLRVTVQTTGSDLDPSGYDVLVDQTRVAAVDPDGATLVSVPAGTRTVALGGVNPNCAVADPASQEVGLSGGQLGVVRFEIQCLVMPLAGRSREVVYASFDDRTELSTLTVANDDGSHSEALFPQISYAHDTPAWAPDGNRIAYNAYPNDSTTVLTVAQADGTVLEEFKEKGTSGSPTIAWSPEGSALTIASIHEQCGLRVFPLDGSPEARVNLGCDFGEVRSVSLSPDGLQLAFILLMDTQTSPPFSFLEVTDLENPEDGVVPPGCDLAEPTEVSWSPDGARLALADDGIVVLDLITSTCTRLTDEPSDASPSWSPDGGRIAFSSGRDGNREIYVMQADGSSITRITRSPSFDTDPSWRP